MVKKNKQQEEIKIWKIFAYTMSAIVIIFGIGLIFQLLSYGKLLDENIELMNSEYPKPHHTSLEVWEENQNWRFEHLSFNSSRYMIGIYNNTRYVMDYSNYIQNESFDYVFDFEKDFCSIRFYNQSCGEEGSYGDCFKEWRIEGKPEIYKHEY